MILKVVYLCMKYDEQNIIDKYNEGVSPKQIGEMLGTYNTTIRRILIRNGIVPQNCSERRRVVKSIPFTIEDQY